MKNTIELYQHDIIERFKDLTASELKFEHFKVPFQAFAYASYVYYIAYSGEKFTLKAIRPEENNK